MYDSLKRKKPSLLRRLFLILFAFICVLFILNYTINKIDDAKNIGHEFLLNQIANEEWFANGTKGDNIIGFKNIIVPNIIHYVILKDHQISFGQYICIKSVLINHKPDIIMIHCDCDDLYGYYWQKLKDQYKNFNFTIRRVEIRETIFGKKYDSTFHLWHLSDVIRIMALMEFGGIYLDRDVYVVKSLDYFRKFEMTVILSHDFMANNLLIGHKRSRFLKLYLNSYRKYKSGCWLCTSMIDPLNDIINKFPDLVHKTYAGINGLDAGFSTCSIVYKQNSKTWRNDYYAIHIMMRNSSIAHDQWCFGGKNNIPKPDTFTEDNIKTLNTTFGQMARLILHNTTDLIL